ncbi:MAG: MFS transporter [Deltaproteobacteria bacterium]|nr:MFS transporter [Deltaproteobacteria bacterium]MBI3387190.1 MFS transporter [Deltaproteobacteria bacterium]
MPALLAGPFLLVTLANFCFFLNFASFFLLPLHIKALGGSEAMVGAVMGTNGLASLLVLPLIGSAVDRVGRRPFLVAGAIGMSAASFSFVWVDSVGPWMFILRLCQGVSFAAAFTASTTMAAELAPRTQRAQALGLFGLSTIVTHAIAPAIGEEIVQRGGFHTLFIIAASCSAVSAALATRLPAIRTTHATSTPAPWRVDTLQWVLVGTVALSGMGFGTVMTFIPTFVRGEGFGRVGFFYGAYTTTAILTRLIGAGLSDSLGRRAVILPTLLVLATSILALAFVHSIPALVATGLLFGAAQGVNYPTLHAFIVDLTADEHLGRVQALFNGAFNLGVTGSAFLFGSVAEHAGHRPTFMLAAAMPAVAWMLLYLFGASTREPAINH